jgi:hypothetical protein
MANIHDKRLILMYALVLTCHYNHSGQWSRGYRLLCKTQQWLSRHRQICNVIDTWEYNIRLVNQEFVKQVNLKIKELSLKYAGEL